MRTPPDYEIVQHSSRDPIVLVGAPGKLRGMVALHNRGDQRVALDHARICRLPQELAGLEAPEIGARLAAILRPGQNGRASIQVGLNPHTPPGEYAVEVALGDYSYPALLRVTEVVDLEVSPDPVVIENRPGGRHRKEIVVKNSGNVVLAVGSFGPVPLDEELLSCRSLRGALTEAFDTAERWDDWLSAYLREGKKGLDKAGMLWVKNLDGTVMVAPGEVRTIPLEIRQPATNDPHSRYSALAFLHTANVTFVVAPGGHGHGESLYPEEPEPGSPKRVARGAGRATARKQPRKKPARADGKNARRSP